MTLFLHPAAIKAVKVNKVLAPLSQSQREPSIYIFSEKSGTPLKTKERINRGILHALTSSLTIRNGSQAQAHKIFHLLQTLELNPNLEQDSKLLDAGWQSIDWDKFEKLFYTALEEAIEELNQEKLTINYHNFGNEIILNSDQNENTKNGPIWAKTTQDESGKKIIHIAEGFIASHWHTENHLERLFLFEILFYYTMENKVVKILEELSVSSPKILAVPLLETLSSLSSKWFHNDGELPKITQIQQNNMTLAAEKEWLDYLNSIPDQSSLDFDQAQFKHKTKVLNALKATNKLFPTKEYLMFILDKFLKQCEMTEKFKFYYPILEREEVSKEIKEKVLSVLDLPSDVDQELVLTLFLAKVRDLLIAQNIQLEKDKIKPIYESSISHCYRYTTDQGPDFFIKVPRTALQAFYLGLEYKMLDFILGDEARPDFFVDQVRGLRIVNINNRSHVALVMNFVDPSEDLDDFVKRKIKEEGQVSAQQILSITQQLVEAFTYFKKRGIFLRDPKPKNILVQEDTETGEVSIKMIDFGASHFDKESPHEEDEVVGTKFFISPQEWLPDSPYSFDEELYKLGVILYFMLSGDKFPFKSPGIIDSETHYRETSPQRLARETMNNPLAALNPNDSSDKRLQVLAKIVNKMLQKEVDDRYEGLEQTRLTLIMNGILPDSVGRTHRQPIQRLLFPQPEVDTSI